MRPSLRLRRAKLGDSGTCRTPGSAPETAATPGAHRCAKAERTPRRPRRQSILHCSRSGIPALVARRTRLSARSHGDRRFDRAVRVIVEQLEVFETVVEQAPGSALDDEPRQRQRLTRELKLGLNQVVRIEMAIA